MSPGATNGEPAFEAPAAEGGRVESTEALDGEVRLHWPGPPPASVAIAAVGVFALGLLAAVARSHRDPDLGRGEVMLFRSKPRKALKRYAFSLGLWELTRRTTSFGVTQRRVIVQRGFLRQHTRSIPLSGIADVDLVLKPWEATVRISELGSGTTASAEIGPLRTATARKLATTITAAIASGR